MVGRNEGHMGEISVEFLRWEHETRAATASVLGLHNAWVIAEAFRQIGLLRAFRDELIAKVKRGG